MTKRMNWSHQNERARMARHGVEDVKAKTSVVNPLLAKRPWRLPVSKAEQRVAAAKAFQEWRRGRGR
jgi:hypothetical protein